LENFGFKKTRRASRQKKIGRKTKKKYNFEKRGESIKNRKGRRQKISKRGVFGKFWFKKNQKRNKEKESTKKKSAERLRKNTILKIEDKVNKIGEGAGKKIY